MWLSFWGNWIHSSRQVQIKFETKFYMPKVSCYNFWCSFQIEKRINWNQIWTKYYICNKIWIFHFCQNWKIEFFRVHNGDNVKSHLIFEPLSTTSRVCLDFGANPQKNLENQSPNPKVLECEKMTIQPILNHLDFGAKSQCSRMDNFKSPLTLEPLYKTSRMWFWFWK